MTGLSVGCVCVINARQMFLFSLHYLFWRVHFVSKDVPEIRSYSLQTETINQLEATKLVEREMFVCLFCLVALLTQLTQLFKNKK